jgi:hypothetical protein
MKKFIISEEERKSILNQHLNLKHILQEKAGKKNNIILEYDEPITDEDFFKQAVQYNCIANGNYDRTMKGYVIPSASVDSGNFIKTGDYVVLFKNWTYDVYNPGGTGRKVNGKPWDCPELKQKLSTETDAEIDALIKTTMVTPTLYGYQKKSTLPPEARLDPEGNGYTTTTYIKKDGTSVVLYVDKDLKGYFPKKITSVTLEELKKYKDDYGYVEFVLKPDEFKYTNVKAPLTSDPNHTMWKISPAYQTVDPGGKSTLKSDLDALAALDRNASNDLNSESCKSLIDSWYSKAISPNGNAAKGLVANQGLMTRTRDTIQDCIDKHMDKQGFLNMKGHGTTKKIEYLTSNKVPSGWGFRPSVKR